MHTINLGWWNRTVVEIKIAKLYINKYNTFSKFHISTHWASAGAVVELAKNGSISYIYNFWVEVIFFFVPLRSSNLTRWSQTIVITCAWWKCELLLQACLSLTENYYLFSAINHCARRLSMHETSIAALTRRHKKWRTPKSRSTYWWYTIVVVGNYITCVY